MTKTATQKANGTKSKGKPVPRLTKKQQLIAMLTGKSAHSLDAISTRFGWQAHSTRAALSGLRKADIDVIGKTSEKTGKMTYRIAPAAKADA